MWSWAWLALAFPGAESNREQLVGVVAPHSERMEPEPAFEVRCRLFLLRVRGDQGGVDVEYDRLAEVGAGHRRHRQPGR